MVINFSLNAGIGAGRRVPDMSELDIFGLVNNCCTTPRRSTVGNSMRSIVVVAESGTDHGDALDYART